MLDPAGAGAWGAVGPAARAAGVGEDARADDGDWLAYGEFEPAMNARATGDVAPGSSSASSSYGRPSRCSSDCSSGRSRPTTAIADSTPAERALTRVESPRGATICALERSGDRVGRLHLRTGSYANWPVLARVAPGNLLPDFPLINKSFELCYACADR